MFVPYEGRICYQYSVIKTVLTILYGALLRMTPQAACVGPDSRDTLLEGTVCQAWYCVIDYQGTVSDLSCILQRYASICSHTTLRCHVTLRNLVSVQLSFSVLVVAC